MNHLMKRHLIGKKSTIYDNARSTADIHDTLP